MWITILKSKIHNARVTQAELHYQGSITIPTDVLRAADIVENEKVEVLNLNNGSRIETYAIPGKEGSGVICLNGPAARCGIVGDPLIVLSYAMIEKKDKVYTPKIVYLDDQNKIKN